MAMGSHNLSVYYVHYSPKSFSYWYDCDMIYDMMIWYDWYDMIWYDMMIWCDICYDVIYDIWYMIR
jgi:hypothetical protein